MRAILAAYCIGVLLGTFSQELLLSAALTLSGAALLMIPDAYAVFTRSRSSESRRSSYRRSYRRSRTRASGNLRQYTRYIAVSLLIGLGYHALWASHALSVRLSDSLTGETVSVRGEVVSIPRAGSRASTFLFRVDEGEDSLRGRLVRVSDYQGLGVAAGQIWQMSLRLRPPHGLANPGGFDSESWFLQHAVVASGYVRGEARLLSEGNWFGLSRLRGSLLKTIEQAVPPDSTAQEVLPALLLGHDAGISPRLRQLFAETGTSHLFVISGLHIGLIAVVVLKIIERLLRYCPWFSVWLSTRFTVQHVATCFALCAAFLYALLSGFELPAQRALVMLVVFALASLRAQAINIWVRYWLALAIVLTLNPLAASTAGFWLSFVAVGVLLCTLPHRRESPGLCNLLKPQLLVFVGLFLPLGFWMGQVALLAPLINLAAIPLIGLLLVPLAFLALLVVLLDQGLGVLLFSLVAALTDLFIAGLYQMSHLAQHAPHLTRLSLHSMNPLLLTSGTVAVLLMLLPWPMRWRWLAAPLLLPVLAGGSLANTGETDDETLVVRVFDVGQGLAVLLSVGNRHLLYDTGAGDEQGFSMAESVLLPAFRKLGIRRLDSLLISHWDNDHAGGVSVLREFQPGLTILTSVIPRKNGRVAGDQDYELCRAGQDWQWGRVEFTILHPQALREGNNDNSCVLHVRIGQQSVLLPGDISREVEYELASDLGGRLDSTVILAPHHGSRTSSSYPLLKSSMPDWVVFSAGASNSFGHPAREIVDRYAQAGVGLLGTANSGMLTFRLDGSPEAVEPERYRVAHRRYWRRSQNDYWCRYSDQVCDTLSR